MNAKRIRFLALLAISLVFLLAWAFPVVWSVLNSFKTDRDALAYPPKLFFSPTLDAYRDVLFGSGSILPNLISSMVISVGTTVVTMLMAVPAAYALARLRFRGSEFIGTAIFVTYLVPTSLLFIPMVNVMAQLHLDDSIWSLVVVYPTFLVPFVTWLMSGYFRTIPTELEDCARIDGMTRLGAMWKIAIPLARPGILSAGIFAFTLSWNEFIYALTLVTASAERTIPVGVLVQLTRADFYFWGPLMAGALMGSVPVALVYSFFVDQYASGLTAGAVKG